MSVIADLPASAKELYRKPPGGRADATSSSATITWWVPDADLIAFQNTVAGKVELIGGLGGAVLRVVPLQHPLYTWMYARSMDWTAFGWDNENEVRHHEVRVEFGNLPWPVDGNEAFLTRNSQPSVRTMDLPKAGVLVGSAEPSNDRSTVVEGFDMSITIHQLPYTNEAAWYSLGSSVNSDTFFGVAPGYVKYLGPGFSNSITFAGVRTWEVTHNFSFSPIPWNQEFDESGSLADLSVGGGPRYPGLDFWATFFAT